jgi:hypothetical protein
VFLRNVGFIGVVGATDIESSASQSARTKATPTPIGSLTA